MGDEHETAMAGPDAGVSAVERIKHEDEAGEYWLARELASLLGYTAWRHFEEVIDEVKAVCQTNGSDAALRGFYPFLGQPDGIV